MITEKIIWLSIRETKSRVKPARLQKLTTKKNNITKEDQMSNEIVKTDSLPITSMEDLATAGRLLAQSGMFGCHNDAEGFVIAATCFQQGITLMDFIRTYHLIENKPAMKADAMAAEYRKRGGRFKILERSPNLAKAEFEFEKQKVIFEFSMEEAKANGICTASNGTMKANWQKHPTNMLWARMMSNAVRTLCPEVNAGLYTPEEVSDFDNHKEPKEEKIVDPESVVVENIKTATPKAESEKKQKEPKKVTVEVVQEKPKTEKPEKETPFKKSEGKEEKVDYSICQIAPHQGKKWSDMPLNLLESALNIPDEQLPPAYKDFIKKIIDEKRKEGEGK